MANENAPAAVKLQRAVDPARDHVRGGNDADAISVVLYADYLCPYCRRLRPVMKRLRQAFGERLAYVFRHFPNERAHPGAEFFSRVAEAAGKQDRFWEMHDWLYDHEPPLTRDDAFEYARSLGLDMERFNRDVEADETRTRVEEDLVEGRRNGVAGTPTLFVDGLRYDGAWDFYSMLEALERPVAKRVERSARAFASLPASGGLMLLIAAAAALVCANTPLAPYYRRFIESSFDIGTPGHMLSLTVQAWFSEGLLAIFFLLVGLEIRREMTAGALADRRAAVLPVVAAIGGVLAPAAIYLMLNRGPAAAGWSRARPRPMSPSRSVSLPCSGAAFLPGCACSSLRSRSSMTFFPYSRSQSSIRTISSRAGCSQAALPLRCCSRSIAHVFTQHGLMPSSRWHWHFFSTRPAFTPRLRASSWPPSCRHVLRQRRPLYSLRLRLRSRSSSMRSTN